MVINSTAPLKVLSNISQSLKTQIKFIIKTNNPSSYKSICVFLYLDV